jgi:hypothetical protein
MRWIVTSVSVNPSAVCSVSIVPTRERSASSATDAENWAESATMLIPQTMHTATSATGEPPNSSPIVAAQLPLTAIATIVSVVRPSRSARTPAPTHPIAPDAIVTNAASLAAVPATSGGSVSAKLACRKTPIHAHIA